MEPSKEPKDLAPAKGGEAPPRTSLTTLRPVLTFDEALKAEMGPLLRGVAAHYFPSVRFTQEDEEQLRKLHETGFVVHVMRSTAWVNFVYLTWALLRRGLPPVRAVVNLRRWFSRPWRNCAQRGDFDVRFTYARRQGGSGLIFLRKSALGRPEGKNIREDPFPALVSLARKGDRTVYLVPELFVWEQWTKKLQPTVWDRVFGSPETPGFLHSLIAFWRNHKRAQFRVGEPVDLRQFIQDNPDDSDEVLARKVRGALTLHLARETRSIFGPPVKHPDRLIEETLRDRVLRHTLDEEEKRTGKPREALVKTARTNLEAIAARMSPLLVGTVAAPVLRWFFERIYDGIEVDESGLERAMRAARGAPIVLCPSHKSHVDYLVLSYVLWARGYTPPVVAAGANLSFFPLGWLLRRVGAFFLRRSFKDDRVYTASFRAYLKKLVHDRVPQEFFPEGGRSRTGKLLPPKLGIFTWQVDAVLEGASDDLVFVPVAIDYEKVVESKSYSRELAGGEKKAEDLKALLTAPKVLAARYGRIHLGFDHPVSLAELMQSRGLSADQLPSDEQRKALVRALGNRVMYGISRVSTVTPAALASAALLAGPGRGVGARELSSRIGFLRQIAEDEGVPLSRSLAGSPSDVSVLGPIQEALKTFEADELVKTQEIKGEAVYIPDEPRRAELSFYKNTLMNLLAPRSLVACGLLSGGGTAPLKQVKERALFLSRLFKVEFIYRVGLSFDALFADAVARLERMNLVVVSGDELGLAPDPDARPRMEFLAAQLRDFLEAYLVAALTLEDVAREKSMDKKGFVKASMETGRGQLLEGRLRAPESLSRTWVENAVLYFLDRGVLVEADKKLSLGPSAQSEADRRALVEAIQRFLPRS